jgi:hypothetical protein
MANDLIDEGFESGTNGVAVSSSNSTILTQDGTAGDITFTNSPVHEGSLAATVSTSSTYKTLIWSFSAQTDAWFVFRIYFTALPAANTYLARFTAASDANKIGDIRINTNGTLAIRNNFTAVATTTTPLTTNTWHRIAFRVTPNTTNGLTLKTYIGANVDGATATETVQGNSTQNFSIERLRLGVPAAATWTYTMDLVEGSSTAEPIPSVADTIDPVAVVSHVATDATFNSSDTLTGCTFDVTAAASTDNVGVTGYSWSDNGAGGSFSSTTAAAPTWTPPDLTSGPWTLTCTVSDAASNTDSAGVVVDIPATGGAGSPVAGVAVAASGSAI